MRLLRALAALGLLAVAACGGGDGGILGIGGNGGGTTGSIRGQVTSNGTGMGGVSVVLVNRDTTQTSGNGTYSFPNVAAGSYTVSILVPVGFVLGAGEDASRTVTVAERGTATVNWRLQRAVGAGPGAARAPAVRAAPPPRR